MTTANVRQPGRVTALRANDTFDPAAETTARKIPSTPRDPAKAAAQFRRAAQRHALQALEALVTLSRSASSESVRVSAANAVIDRAHGRPASAAKAAGPPDSDDGERVNYVIEWP